MLRLAAWPYLCFWVLPAVLGAADSQNQAPPPKTPDEVTTHETPATFRTKVNLVLVPVIVRDKQGRAVGDLRKEDFQLFDKGKPQTISSFSVETIASQTAEPVKIETPPQVSGQESPATVNPADVPKRFVIYLFDDVHISQGDLMQVRAAADRHIDASLVPTDRAAIYTTSGRTMLDFTDDHAKMHATLLRITPQPIARARSQLCPDISYYQADLIINDNDPSALQAAVQDAIACMTLDPTDKSSVQTAQSMSRATASQVVNTGESESRAVLRFAEGCGPPPRDHAGAAQHHPGFSGIPDAAPICSKTRPRSSTAPYGPTSSSASLNARGLYTVVPGGDASQPAAQSVAGVIMRSQYLETSAPRRGGCARRIRLRNGRRILSQQQRPGRWIQTGGGAPGICLCAGLLAAKPEARRRAFTV